MAASVPFSQMQLGFSPSAAACDLVIAPTGYGRGRIAIDTTSATALLIALGSDRRADDGDILPPDLTGQNNASLTARRGWPGDILLPEGERLGCKNWLLARAMRTEETRLLAAGNAAQAVARTAGYHGVAISTDAVWSARYRGRLFVTVTETDTDVTVSVPV